MSRSKRKSTGGKAPKAAYEAARGKKRPAGEAFTDDPELDPIAPNGDVTFVLDEGDTRVQVNSAIMKNASPVFAAMLGPNFKEGRALDAGGPTSIDVPLPEDDAVAFEWICRVLHSQADTNLWSPSPEEIVEVLDIAEKYDLLKGIQISVTVWIDENMDADNDDLWLLSLACHRAYDEENFESVTRSLLIHHTGSFIELAGETESDIPGPDAGRIMYRLAGILEESRNKTFSEISKFLHTDLPEALEKCHCNTSRDFPHAHVQALEVQKKVTQLSFNSIKNTVDTLSDVLLTTFASGGCKDCAKSRLREYKRVRAIITELEDDVEGICLACFD